MVRASTSIGIGLSCAQFELAANSAFSHVAGVGATLSATAAFSPFISRLSRRLSRHLGCAYDVMHRCKDLELEIALRTHFGAGCRPGRIDDAERADPRTAR